jgi:hypothetical protein
VNDAALIRLARALHLLIPPAVEMSGAIRMRSFLPAVITVLVLAGQPARAQPRTAGCAGSHWNLVLNGITFLEGHTTAGQPCQLGFGLRGGNVETLEIVVRPAHGGLGASGKQENRRFVAYVPASGFVGHDRFEVFVRITPPGMPPGPATFTSRIKVEMNVTP